MTPLYYQSNCFLFTYDCASVFCNVYLLIFVLIWATSLDEHFAFLVTRYCALYSYVDEFMLSCTVG